MKTDCFIPGKLGNMVEKPDCSTIYTFNGHSVAPIGRNLEAFLGAWKTHFELQSMKIHDDALIKYNKTTLIRKNYAILYLDECDTSCVDTLFEYIQSTQNNYSIMYDIKFYRASTSTVCVAAKHTEIDISYNISRGLNSMINYWYNQIRIQKTKINLFISNIDLLCDTQYIISLALLVLCDNGTAIIKMPDEICDHICSYIYIACSNFEKVYMENYYLYLINFKPLKIVNVIRKIFNKEKYICDASLEYNTFVENLKDTLIISE